VIIAEMAFDFRFEQTALAVFDVRLDHDVRKYHPATRACQGQGFSFLQIARWMESPNSYDE